MDWKPIIDQILSILIPTVITALTIIAGLALNHLRNWAAAKSKNEEAKTKGEEAKAEGESIKTAVLQIATSAASSVNEIEVTTRRFMSDGVLSESEINTLRTMASDMVKAQVPKAMETLTAAGMENVSQFVSGKVQQAVAAMPNKTKKEDC